MVNATNICSYIYHWNYHMTEKFPISNLCEVVLVCLDPVSDQWLLTYSLITLIIVDFCRMLKLYKLSRRYTLDLMHKTSQIEIIRKSMTPRLSCRENVKIQFWTKIQEKLNETAKSACKIVFTNKCFKFKFYSKFQNEKQRSKDLLISRLFA